ncbi:CRISPR-associated helicase Cas3' [Mariniphaga anaerophila]|uniref:CRISPR-associated helicase Cas3' n=1 Tax=Mariniphaga anaerophila TaxID=1484053 RepID=UPI001C319652|nr:CRISPR-associated helicase Cas3' [Mariniphaga anaerophila]
MAKPSGITLEQHTQGVMSEGKLLLEQTPFVVQKYKQRIGKNLFNRLKVVCEYHDVGKKAEPWQSACQKDYEAFLEWQSQHGGSFKEYAIKEDSGKHIRKANFRHELHSLHMVKKAKLPLALLAAIAAHHRKLGFNFRERWANQKMSDFWKVFETESNRIIEKYSLEISAKNHYEFAGPRGLLQLVDHRVSAKEEKEEVPEFTKFSYKFPWNEKTGVQKLVDKYWRDNLLLVRAPTGAGKTDASLLWASLQIANKRADRLIIAMPTRFTSNALAINVAESLSDTGLYHSSAWFNKFQEQIEDGTIEKKKADKLHEFARLLQTPITVCTIDHLLMALTLTREDHHLIAFNMANSCLVIDEADFYDDFTQANILVLLEILKYWNVPVLLMSASLPESVLPSYQKIGYKVNQIVEDTSDNLRNRFEIKAIQNYTELSEIENLLEKCVEKRTAIIYANTVDKAVLFYDWFEKRNANPILYHSRFTEPDKKDKEDELINALGKKAWKKGSAKGIAILTQIGEMSINISADLMISELCPIDRLTQRTGRLCRFDKSKIGELYVLIPQKNDLVYPAPYGEYDKKAKAWVPCEVFTKTAKMLETTFYNANKLVEMLNQVYAAETSFSSRAISNAKDLKEYFQYNWLINPMQKPATDDIDTNFWKSRNIAPQDTVFVKEPESLHFYNYLDFQSWKLKYSLELPIYLIEKGKKQHKIDIKHITIKDEQEPIFVIRKNFYNNTMGVTFVEENQLM